MTEHVITRRSVASWVIYDLANTIFSMGVVSLYFSLWVRDAVGAERADSVYGTITAVSMGIIFIISPLLGAMTDRASRRMPFLIVSTVVCVAFTSLLGRVGTTGTIIAFIVANATYQAGLQFYDALLPDVSTDANRGKISGIGVGVGYLGSYVAVGLGLALGTQDKSRLFLYIALAFLVLSLPCFVFVRERGNPNPRPIFELRDLVRSVTDTIATLRQGKKYPGLGRFLFGRIFYTDAINTVIAIMSLYTVNIAIAHGNTKAEGERTAQLVLMGAITFAVVGGFAWGWLVDRIGPKRTLDAVLALWIAVFSLAAAMGLGSLPLWVLYVVAAGAGVALGGIWAADRPLMLRLTPPDRVGEFYGLYNMVGRFSAVIGPSIWAITAKLTIERNMAPARGQGIGVLVLLAMIVVSVVVLRRVNDAPRDWSAERGEEAVLAAASGA